MSVKTAIDIVPIMKLSELLNFSINGGLESCCVQVDRRLGRGMVIEKSTTGGYTSFRPVVRGTVFTLEIYIYW